MRFYLVCIILFLTTICRSFGQAYKYISVTEGLSDRRVLSIQKDKAGFIWFLTYTGIDRYDGKDFKHYRLQSDEGYISLFSEKSILKTDCRGKIWAIGEQGELFAYDQPTDRFIQKQLPPEITKQDIERVEMTDFDEVWYCYPQHCYTYNLQTNSLQHIHTDHDHKHITCIYQYDENTCFIGSEDGICKAVVHQGRMIATECIIPSQICKHPQIIYMHPATNRLMAYSEKDGMIVYDLTLKQTEAQYPKLKDFPITSFTPYENRYILIPTRGAGIYRYDLKGKKLEQYMYASDKEPNKMNGNNIRALLVDEKDRLWISVYARSITVYDKSLPQYTWYKKYIGNPNSLNDELVNAVLEDKEGNIWFATNNGLSIYNPHADTWKHLFQWEENNFETFKNCIFLSLHETNDGNIIAGGFMTGVYSINKKTLKATLLTPHTYKRNSNPNFTNNYIRAIYQDDKGVMWTGGNYYLGCVDHRKQTFKDYFIGSSVTCLLEKDSTTLLIGTGDGMYSMNRQTEEIKKMRMPFASGQINTMYMHPNGDLYIGTTNSGLVILHADGRHHIYRMQTSALLSNTINDIIPKNEHEIVIVTEQNIAMYYARQGRFQNWTEDLGLIKTNFNPRAGIHTSRGTFIVGSGNGAIEWSDTMKLPRGSEIPIIIDQIRTTNQQTVNETHTYSSLDSLNILRLPYEKNILSIQLTTVDYHNPSNTYFKWKLEGYNNYWTTTPRNSRLQFRHLKPGEYTLHIQNIAREDYRTLGNKQLKIIIEPSFWQTGWAILLYLLITGTAILICWQIIRLKFNWIKTKKKLSIFTRNAQSLQTPLALIKAAIHDVKEHEPLSPKGQTLLNMVNHNADSIQQMTTNLINIERQSIIKYKRELEVSLYPLNSLIGLYADLFTPLATQQSITLEYRKMEIETNVWVNSQKMELIFYNLLANIIRYTKPGGKISIHNRAGVKRWSVTISNEPQQEPSFPSSSADEVFHMDKEEFASEMSVILQLVKRHYGNLHYEKSFPGAYIFEVSFPTEHTGYKKEGDESPTSPTAYFMELWEALRPAGYDAENELPKKGHILLVEENAGTLAYLDTILNEEWDISMAHSTETALEIICDTQPDIIIATFIAPKQVGEDLCSIIKADKITSHIPVILLTSEGDKAQIEKQYKIQAEYYINMPADILSVRTVLRNLQDNHKLQKERIAKADMKQNRKEIRQASIRLESDFLTEIKELVNLHIDNPHFNVDNLCNLLGMSRTTLYEKLKQITPLSPSDIIREVRLTKAAEMLLTNKYTIIEVSDSMGFSEPKYFREVFKKHFGMTPSEYIKKEIGK